MRVKADEASKCALNGRLAAWPSYKSYCELNLIREPRVIFLFAGPPTILVKPQSQQVKAGGIASFYCTAEGSPPPQIHWRKNSKRISRKSRAYFHIFSFPVSISVGVFESRRFIESARGCALWCSTCAKSVFSRFGNRTRCGEKEWKFYPN